MHSRETYLTRQTGRKTRHFDVALINWERATPEERAVPLAFWDAMMAANASETFASQQGVYGLGADGVEASLSRITGLRGANLEKVMDQLHSSGEFDIPHALRRAHEEEVRDRRYRR